MENKMMLNTLALLLVVGMWFGADQIVETVFGTPVAVQAEADPAGGKTDVPSELTLPANQVFESLRSANLVRCIGLTLLAILMLGMSSGIISGGGFMSLPPYEPGVTVHATEKFPAIVPVKAQWETPDFWQQLPEVGRLIVLRKKGA